jgi:hypothetical protein
LRSKSSGASGENVSMNYVGFREEHLTMPRRADA